MPLTLENIFEKYIAWFAEHALEGIAPPAREQLNLQQTHNEDLYEDDRCVVNRTCYLLPLLPSQSKSGRLEVFSFSELNLMFKNPDGDPEEVFPVEYRLE